MDPEKAKRHVPPPSEPFTYRNRDVILYALGVGAGTAEDLCYLYESHEDFAVLPTFIVAPGLLANSISDWPGIRFDLSRILHGEQYVELFEPLPSEGILVSKTRVVDLIDKGKGALILADVATFDQKTGRQLAIQQFGTFQVGGGGFGGIRSSPHERATVPVPNRAPDMAALYRLGSGDLNPLHIDPQFAQMSGFDRPILHGLCSLGFSTRHILKAFANNDASRFKAIKVRFSMPVLPGQTLQTEMWKQGDRIHFQTKVKETGKVVLSAGYMDLWPVTKSAKL